MKSITTRFTALGAVLAIASTASAQNWPQFRGPGATGLGDGKPPVKWDVQKGDNVRWKSAIPGLAHSSPIVWGERVYVTSAIGEKKAEFQTGWLQGTGDSASDDWPVEWKLLCLDARTGKTAWERTCCRGVPKVKRHVKATHANSTPATDGKNVVAFFGSEGLYCYDTGGELKWKADLGVIQSAPHDAPDLQWGFASSPVIHEDKVIVQCDGSNTAFWAVLDLATGKEIRRVKREDVATWSTPAVITTGGRAQVVCNGWKQAGGWDLATGELLWTLHDGGDVPVPTPFLAGALIVLTNSHGRKPIYVIRPDARGDITPTGGKDNQPKAIAWWNRAGGSYMPTPIAVGENLYVGDDDGRLSVRRIADGKTVYRARISSSSSTYSASPVAAGGHIYFTSEDGDVHVIRDGDTFELLASNAMGETCMATPAIAAGRLYVRGAEHLFCIGDADRQ